VNATTRLALITRLSEHPLLGAPEVSLWFGHAPDEALPPVVLLTLDNDRRMLAHSGPVGLAEADFSVDVWAADDETAINLREAAISQLHGFAGVVTVDSGNGGTDTAEITHCIHESSSEDYDAASNLARTGASFSLGYK